MGRASVIREYVDDYVRYYPGKTAEEMFLRGEENEDSGNP